MKYKLYKLSLRTCTQVQGRACKQPLEIVERSLISVYSGVCRCEDKINPGDFTYDSILEVICIY